MVQRYWILAALVLCSMPPRAEGQKKPLTLEDMMRFRQLESPVISHDGQWVACVARPDRGDGEVQVYSTKKRVTYGVSRAAKPSFSNDGRWVAMVLRAPALELERKSSEKDRPKEGMVLLDVTSGDTLLVYGIASYAFSEDSRWFAYQRSKEEKKTGKGEGGIDTAGRSKSGAREKTGTDLVLRHLSSSRELIVPFVTVYVFDSTSTYLAYAVADSNGEQNGVYLRDLREASVPEDRMYLRRNGAFTHLAWTGSTRKLAFLAAVFDDKENTGRAALWVWEGKGAYEAVAPDDLPKGWIIPSKNDVVWSKDGRRLFIGLKPESAQEQKGKEGKDSLTEAALFDVETIVKKSELDVWHWDDPRIMSNQKKRWKEEKDRTYRAVYHVDGKKLVPLADPDLPVVPVPENSDVALGLSNVPYLREITWRGESNDVYILDLEKGSRRMVVRHLDGPVYLSPSGSSLVFYRDKCWFLADVATGSTENLTERIEVAFHDEEDDRPGPPPPYGFAGWVEGGQGVLLYDRHDIWQFDTRTQKGRNITGGVGRRGNYEFRIQKLDLRETSFKEGERLLLTAFHYQRKHTAFYAAWVGGSGATKLIEEPRKYTFLAKARSADVIMLTRQSYKEFPDIMVSDLAVKSTRKVTDANPQVAEFAWGSAELLEWTSMDGRPLQGVLIKPENYEAGKRYPVLVYFYERSSHRLYEFNEVVVNHRPCFPFYAGNGYAVFLPDVQYEVGRPGFSALKCIVPGVQKLIETGVAESKAIALHGHSWGGYQTAYVVTQTSIFACAIAGAAVSNMSSAYSGIRLETGLARQFQYERDQSRIGGSLWERRDAYLENSPVFYADRITTPLLLQFGDEDEAVPWQQGIELYLAMRRLGKDCVLLQYRGEAHHLKKYPNKVDYAIRFKEYLDHYLKGASAPPWLVKGVPYHE